MIILTIPNILSLMRVPLALAFLVDSVPLRITVLALAALTDFLDGFLARRSGSTSAFGAVLDPITDKIFVFTAVIALFLENTLGLWEALALVSRDFAMGCFAAYLCLTGGWRGYAPRAFAWGKVTTVAQYIVLALIVLSVPLSPWVYGAFLFLALGYLVELLVRYHRS